MEFNKKPFIWILIGALVLAIAVVIGKGFTSGSLSMENADFLRQKMAPALNETTGFLVISYAVILSIGNVIMKTSPKYLKGLSQGTSKTSGFVAWLQQANMSWLPVLVSLGVTVVASLLPINNKIVKILIVGGTLLATLVASLFFNAIAKLFTAKESFTNVKEEFGHMVNGKPHNLNINVGINDNGQIYTGVNYSDDGEGVEKHNITGRTRTHTYEIKKENLTNTVAIKLGQKFYYVGGNTETSKLGAKIFITDIPIGQTSGDHNAREVSEKEGEEISITVEGPEKKIYVHAIPDDMIQKYTTHVETLLTDGTVAEERKPFEDAKAALTAYKNAQTAVATAKDGLAIAVTNNKNPNEQTKKALADKTVALETAEKTYSNAIYDALLKMRKKTLPDFPDDYYNIAMSDGDGSNEKENHGLIITLKNMEQFFGFDAGKVKDSVRASYIAYYCLVWISFLGYAFVNWLQTKKFPKSLLPFMGAAFVETALIGQSHYSLNESDVGGFEEASPTFSYAVAGFSTRIATVVAFLSSILTQVKD